MDVLRTTAEAIWYGTTVNFNCTITDFLQLRQTINDYSRRLCLHRTRCRRHGYGEHAFGTAHRFKLQSCPVVAASPDQYFSSAQLDRIPRSVADCSASCCATAQTLYSLWFGRCAASDPIPCATQAQYCGSGFVLRVVNRHLHFGLSPAHGSSIVEEAALPGLSRVRSHVHPQRVHRSRTFERQGRLSGWREDVRRDLLWDFDSYLG